MGLIKEGDDVAILTDILGLEDALGDMDFKIAGTRDGVTAIQMDIKIEGLTHEILETAFERAHQARMHILDHMDQALAEPRSDLSRTRRASSASRSTRRRSAILSDPRARPFAPSKRSPAPKSTSMIADS